MLEHEGPDPLSGVFPATNGAPDWPELDTLRLYGDPKVEDVPVGILDDGTIVTAPPVSTDDDD